MSVVVSTPRLKYELAIRGMTAVRLAKTAGLSAATMSAALAGKPISETSLGLIADALHATPVSEFIQRLLGPFARWPGADEPAAPATDRP
jgi:lambda repressor-like predicted transcriptional regulator